MNHHDRCKYSNTTAESRLSPGMLSLIIVESEHLLDNGRWLVLCEEVKENHFFLIDRYLPWF